MDINLLPLIFLSLGTLGVVLFGVTLTPALNGRGVVTIRLRIVAISMLAVGMLVFGVTFIAVG